MTLPARLYRGLALLLLVSNAAACERVVDPQTVVVVHAGPATAARTTHVRVTVRRADGSVVHESVRRVPDEVAYPLHLPITAAGGDPARRFAVTVEALDDEAASPFNTLRVEAGFTPAAVIELPVELTDPCADAAPCPSGQTCWQGRCRGACFSGEREGRLAAPACSECQTCGSGACVDLPAGSECGCPGDACQAGRCEVASPVTEVSAGEGHTCLITGPRGLHCAGRNDRGQLGAALPSATTPTLVLENMRAVAAGGTLHPYTCAVEAGSGRALCWGANEDGQLGIGSAGSDVTAPTEVSAAVVFDRVVAGRTHACGVEPSTGAAHCWGSGSRGRLGNGDTVEQASPVRVASEARFVQLCAGAQHSCGLDDGGDISCWGFNQDYQLGSDGPLERLTPSPVARSEGLPWAAVACGAFFSCGLRDDGVVVCWGGNQYGNLGRCEVDRGDAAGSPAPIASDDRFSALACGDSHCCALEERRGALWCWGRGDAGQVGTGATLERRCEPVEVAAGLTFAAIGLGASQSCAIDMQGGLYCWGANASAELGLGHAEAVLSPTRVCLPPGA